MENNGMPTELELKELQEACEFLENENLNNAIEIIEKYVKGFAFE